MEIINELELRRLLKKRQHDSKFNAALVRVLMDESLPWEERRSTWHFLYLTGRRALLMQAIVQALKSKMRVPFDLIIQVCSEAGIKPPPIVVAALLKGARKQGAHEELIGATGWDRFDTRIAQMRAQLLKQKKSEQKQFKDGLLEKFEFLQNQRMYEQAGRVLRRMVELFPEEASFKKLKARFDEQRARDVLSDHLASMSSERMERTYTQPSRKDETMLTCFSEATETLALENRDNATELAFAFFFMDEYTRALECLAWAPASLANDWMRVELLFRARRFIECIEVLNTLEVKLVNDPDSTFAVSYLRAQCLHACGQGAQAMEIMQGIARVRPGYRSANAFIQEWSEGITWE